MAPHLFAIALLAAGQTGPRVWIAGESVKVRPADAPPKDSGPLRIALAAAGNECAGAQIVVQGPARALRASAGPLLGAAQPIAVALSRVATLTLEHPSGPDGAAGEWPDALIPDRDALWGEARNAFPIDVSAGRAQAIFVEVCAPVGLGPGRAAGAVRLTWKGGSARVPLQLALRAFDLPATPALATAFGFSGYSAARGHHKPPEANRELTRLYQTMALRRGITLFGGTQEPPAHQFVGGEARIDWRDYDAEVAPFLDGTALPSGARWTAVELREPARLTRDERRAWRRAWMRHFQERDWSDRLFVYVEDEPPEDRLGAVESRALELLEDLPRARRLATTALSRQAPSIDLWVELINCFAEPPSPTCPRPAPRNSYRDAERKGARVWWYQSCASHGCSPAGGAGPEYAGWPSYMIDAPATAARAMGTLAFAHRIGGELYFDVVYADDQGDPWKTQWAFGGNGDGTLYYPGTPEHIGGAHDAPVESLRLVQIARGLADHAYLSLCERLGDGPLARAQAALLAPSLRGFSRDPRAYGALRERLAARIEELSTKAKASPGAPSVPPGAPASGSGPPEAPPPARAASHR
jgi:hypothetical protein